MTGLCDECLKQKRYNLEPWNLGKGPIDWDINSPWNSMDISTLLHTYNNWMLLPVVPNTFAGGNDGLRPVMLRWHSAGPEDTNAGHCFHQKKSYVFINLGTTTFNFASKNPTWPQFSRSSPPTFTGMPAVFIDADDPPASIESTPQPRAINNGPNNFNGGFGEGRQWPGYHVTDAQWTLWPEKPHYPPPIAWDAMAGQRIAECLGSPALQCFQLFDGVMLDRLVDFAAAAAAAEAARPHPRAGDADQSRLDCCDGSGDFPNARGTQGASSAGDLGGLQDDGRCGDVPGAADVGAGDVLGAKEFSDDVFDRTRSQGHYECVRDGPGNAH